MSTLLRRLGTLDAALIVMGGVIGSGIFINPSVVAGYLHSGTLVMLAWAAGGVVALLGAFLFAELAARRPSDGGFYAYLRDAFHPSLAFSYGFTLLLVSQSGGMAAAAVTFAKYFAPVIGLAHLPSWLLGDAVIALFTLINCFGVREGATTQNFFMALKIVAIGGFAVVGLFAPHVAASAAPDAAAPAGSIFGAFAIAMVPVMFAYSGWQTASFVTAEMKNPGPALARGMVIGVAAIVLLYLAVNAVCLQVLGIHGLAATNTPAADIARLAFGPIGGGIMAAIVAVSTLGFLSNQMLVSPRIYFQMAADGTFFPWLARVHPRTRVPIISIALQGVIAMIVAASGSYSQVLNYVTNIDFLFFGFAAIALIILRRRDDAIGAPKPAISMPLYPLTPIIFLIVAWSIVTAVLLKSPVESLIGIGLLLIGIPIYFLFAASARRKERLA